jgi:four helix bundle protein
MEEGKKKDLEDRLVAFSVSISDLVRSVENTLTGKYLVGQLIRSGISPSLNYGEAKSAESPGDFIHKMKIALKELRETIISLKILRNSKLQQDYSLSDDCIRECNELIAIFVKSIQTAERNRKLKSGG